MLKFLKNITKDHLLVFLLLCCSGNPMWNFVNDVRTNYIICALFTIVLFFRHNKIKTSGFVLYIISFTLISLVQISSVPNASISSGIFLLLKMFIGFVLISVVGYRFPKVYVETMTFIAVISLVGFLYNSFFGIIPGVRHSDYGVSIYIYNQLDSIHTGFVSRNCGMFWEPGAYQGYLNIAVMFALMFDTMKKIKYQILILIIAILTTKSTTGYAVLAFILAYYIMFNYNGKYRILFCVFFALLFVYYYTSLDFLQDKIQTQDFNNQSEGRLNDYARYMPLIKEHFLFGMSAEVANEAPTGNGFLSFLLYYGVFGIVTYFSTLWFHLKRQCNQRVALLMLGVVLLTLQGEGFIYYPCYLAWPFLHLYLDKYGKIGTTEKRLASSAYIVDRSK